METTASNILVHIISMVHKNSYIYLEQTHSRVQIPYQLTCTGRGASDFSKKKTTVGFAVIPAADPAEGRLSIPSCPAFPSPHVYNDPHRKIVSSTISKMPLLSKLSDMHYIMHYSTEELCIDLPFRVKSVAENVPISTILSLLQAIAAV